MSHVSMKKAVAEGREDPHVAEYPGVCGGYPVLRETRIPVRLVVQFNREGATVEELAAMWPTVTTEQIQGALDYYVRQPHRVDQDIERHLKARLSLPRDGRWSA